jgi:hypothetical protein
MKEEEILIHKIRTIEERKGKEESNTERMMSKGLE